MKKANYPKGVRIILDNGGVSADRYTAVYGKDFDYKDERGVVWYLYRAMNRYPLHPQGIGMSAQTEVPFWKKGARYRKMTKKVSWEDLPEQVRECVLLDLHA
jgi:hypothetical protein